MNRHTMTITSKVPIIIYVCCHCRFSLGKTPEKKKKKEKWNFLGYINDF